jgi:hypothetical protein
MIDLHAIPALLDAMSLAGFTLPMAAAALRAAIAADDCKRFPDAQSQEPVRPADVVPCAGEKAEVAGGPAATPAIAGAIAGAIAPLDIRPSPAWQRRRETLRNWGYSPNTRGRLADLDPAIAPLTPAIAPAIAPLSPKVDPKKEGNVAPAIAHPPPPPGAHPLPDDWQPSAGRRLTAVRKGGEIGAANLIAKFSNHFHVRAHELRTAAGWQGRFSNWIISEWPDGDPLRLPLLRPVACGPPPSDKWEAMRQKVHGHTGARTESG